VSEAWEGRAYAEASAHHRAQDDWFLSGHRPGPGDRVVDVGCGSGEFSARLAELVPDGSVIGVEVGWADLVVSRAAFHWIPLDQHQRCYEAVRAVLRPGGVFHCESAGAGNVPRLIATLDHVAAGLGLPPAQVTLLTPSAVLELLEAAGFAPGPEDVRAVAQRRPMSRDALLAMVRTQAVHAWPTDDEPVRERFLAEAIARLDELRRPDGSWDQTFVRLDVLVRR
jgi:SAM-dependent methyltransferase